MADDIPREFYYGDDHPICYTVGDLVEQLKRLPRGMKINQGFGRGVEVIVYNHGRSDCHLEFEEVDE